MSRKQDQGFYFGATTVSQPIIVPNDWFLPSNSLVIGKMGPGEDTTEKIKDLYWKEDVDERR